MAQTYFDLDKEHLINYYRFKPLKDGYLLTNDFGFWVYLSKGEFDLLRHYKISSNSALMSLLKDKGFLITQSNSEKLISDFGKRSRALFRGTYHHVIYLDGNNLNEEEIKENIIKIVNFIIQTRSREITIEFKGRVMEKFLVMKKFVDLFKTKTEKKIIYKIETNLLNASENILEFLINNKFSVWAQIKDITFTGDLFNSIKTLQRRLGINFYLEVGSEILNEGKKIIDFFADNNLKSFFVRKTDEISKEEFVEFWKSALDYTHNINKKYRRIVFYEGFASILLNKILNISDTFYPELNNFCAGAIVNDLAYTLDGNVYANGESIGIELFNIGNVSSSYASIVSNEDSLSLISSSINYDTCLENNVFKPFIGNCPVCNYKEHGNIIPKYSSERAWILTNMLDYLFERILFEEDFLRFILPV